MTYIEALTIGAIFATWLSLRSEITELRKELNKEKDQE